MVFKVQNGVLHDQNGGFYRFYVHDDDAFYDVFYGRGHYDRSYRSYRSYVHVCAQACGVHGRSVLSGASHGRSYHCGRSCDLVCGVHGQNVLNGASHDHCGRSCAQACGVRGLNVQSGDLRGQNVLNGASHGHCGRSCDQACGVRGLNVQSGVLRGRSCRFCVLVCPHGRC